MERMGIREASQVLGMAPETIRWLMQTGHLKIGDVFPSKTGKTHRFVIYRELVQRHVGRNKDEKKG